MNFHFSFNFFVFPAIYGSTWYFLVNKTLNEKICFSPFKFYILFVKTFKSVSSLLSVFFYPFRIDGFSLFLCQLVTGKFEMVDPT